MKYKFSKLFLLKSATSLLLLMFFSNSVLAATWYVDTTADNDPNTCVSGEQDNDDDCTFRDAISQASNSDIIQFLENLTIVNTETGLTSYNITQNGLTVDGTTNTVNFDGNNTGPGSAYAYFKVSGDNVTVNNLNIYNYDGSAIEVNGDNATISNNNLGVQADNATSSEIYAGVAVNTAANTTISGNLIGGASLEGIWVGNGSGTVDATITGNYIGVNSSGTDLNDVGYGVLLETGTMNGGNGGVEGVVIGGSNVSDRNYIAGNENPGVAIVGTATVNGNVVVQNNYIGVAPNGTTGVANAGSALDSRKAGVWVAEEVGTGLTMNLIDNVISGNSGDGVKIDSGGTVNISGNDIGFTASGGVLANQGDGIQADAQTLAIGSNLDGTSDSSEENNIGNNTGNGILLTGDDTLIANIRSNFIGMYEGSSTAFGNGADGINVALTNSGNGTVNIGAVGVTQSTDGRNSIGNNTGDGIDVDTFTTGSSSILTIINNLIGINPNALTDADNTLNGVAVDLSSGTTSLRVGTNGDGTNDASEGNTVTNSGSDGVYAGNGITTLTVAGNAVGAGLDGSGNSNTADGNAGDGIEVNGTGFSSQITIGGDAAAEANIIGNNTGAGVKITDAGSTAQNVRVEGNSIGIGEDGTTALGNTSFGVSIGEAAAISLLNNVISNNATYGVNITGGTTLTVTGNKIGTTLAGTAAAANVSYGIYIAAAAMTTANIGAADGRNIIAGTTATTAPGDGVYVADMADASTITLKNNYIGTDGTTDLGNAGNGIKIADNSGSLTVNIGGLVAGEGNVVSGNNADGIVFNGTASITGSLLANYIGLNAAGTAALANGGDGVLVQNSSNVNLTIGSNNSAGRNVISGNAGDGVFIYDIATGATARLYGNYIGLNAAGTGAIANGDDGFESVDNSGSFNLMIGDVGTGYGNVISGNPDDGVVLGGLATITGYLYGNYVGLNAAGTGAVANGGAGVDAYNANLTLTVGNGASTGRNVISGNTGPGLDLTSGTLTVKGNYIGTNATAAAVLGNGSGTYASGVAFGGILMRAGNLTLGGSTSGQENVISGNYGQGLMVLADTALSVTSNYFGTNSAGTDLGNQLASAITYDLVSGTTEDSALNGTGILFYNNGSGTINNPAISGNVIADNDGPAVAVIGTAAGGGQTWTSGYFKNNFFGSLADQTAAANGSTFEFYSNRNSGSLTGFSVGSSTTSEKNYVKNSSSHLGFKLVDVIASHLAGNGIADFYNNNTFAYSTCPDQQLLQVISGSSQTSTVCTSSTTATTVSSSAGGSASSGSTSSTNQNATEDTQKTETKTETKVEPEKKDQNVPQETESIVEEVKSEPIKQPVTVLEPKPVLEPVTDLEMADTSETTGLPEADAQPLSVSEIENVIADFNAATESNSKDSERDVEIKDFEEANVVRDVVSSGIANLNDEKKKEFRKAVDTILRHSLEEKMKSQMRESGFTDYSFILNLKNRKKLEVDNARSDQQYDAIVQEVLDEILDGGTDIDDNRIDDSLQIASVGTLFEDDADNDGFSLAEEYSFKLDPLKKDVLPKTPRAILPVEKHEIAKVSKRPLLRILGQSNEEVEIFLVNYDENNQEDSSASREQVSIGKVVLDETGKAAFLPETDLPEGKFYVLVKGENGISEELSIIDVDYSEELAAPDIGWSDDEQRDISAGFAEYVYTSVLDAAKDPSPKYLKGKALPGSIVYVTWKSLVLSSVVIADASQGEFEVAIPEDLPEGDHNVLVFAYDPSRSFVGNIASLIFDI